MTLVSPRSIREINVLCRYDVKELSFLREKENGNVRLIVGVNLEITKKNIYIYNKNNDLVRILHLRKQEKVGHAYAGSKQVSFYV